ncbi:DUF3846 domain-containing protein [Kineosporia rhizophila]|uniref:DUF3846 domain-containing protein n=1 Tax=Kineosporia TaxID=49184 RepID=UPI001E2FE5F6|nr:MULTISPECIES: DUF3846 domain-containing protein [Kineosporia]MCE0539866.1 DUF3846 domain-containing protein [Kineosporia rhizophila]GLY19751.1 hypothetical protein Kisp01_67650 [Kineosporia sp. NBRC 101677]
MITVIVIPARLQEPLRALTLEDDRLGVYQELVQGPIEALDLRNPPASFFVNEEAKLRGMELNERATTLAWAHNELMRGQDVIAGPAVLHGPVGPDGESTSAPAELIDLLLNARRFQVEVAPTLEGPFRLVVPEHGDWFDAYQHGLRLSGLSGPARHMRVVAAHA